MTQEPAKVRYAFVDALRGVAAVWVVLFHGYSKNLAPMTGYRLPQPFDAVLGAGYLGVYVFFVISGFAIMHSLRGAHVTPGFIGRFALRRSLRLDPPYWATIAAMIALSYLSGRVQRDHAPLPLPSWESVVAHLFYAQGFLGHPQIVPVFWTLCYEIQFYLVLAVLVGVRRWRCDLARTGWALFAPLWGFSALCVAGVVAPTPALFVYGWPYFFLGVVVNRVHHRDEPPLALAIAAAGTAALIPFEAPRAAVALAAAAALALASARGRLETLSLGRALQHLGRISYSLYLVHMLVGTPLVRLGLRHLGPMDLAHALALLALALAVSVAAAHLLYVVVERPAVRWSRRLASSGPAFVNVAGPAYD